MTSKFDAEIANSALDMLDVFGVDCFVNGLQLKAIFNDDEFQDEAGYRHDLSIEIISSEAQYFAEDDNVFVDGSSYTIRHVPRPSTEDPFVKIGLKRA